MILRVPLRRGESIDSVVYTAAGVSFAYDAGLSVYSSGNDLHHWLGCFAYHCTASRPGVGLRTRREVEGVVTTLKPTWPPEVGCGSETPLTAIGVHPDGTEGYAPPTGKLAMIFSGQDARLADARLELGQIPWDREGSWKPLPPSCSRATCGSWHLRAAAARSRFRQRSSGSRLWA